MSVAKWSSIHQEITQASKKHKRPITIVAVSKGQGPEKIHQILQAPHAPTIFGESYLNEALLKRESLEVHDLQKIDWHFIGRLQSRKIPEIAAQFSCLHTVGRSKEIEMIKEVGKTPKFFLQINTSREKQKNGFTPEETPEAIALCEELGLSESLLGLMTLPSPLDEVGEKNLREEFTRLRKLRDQHLPGKFLNMGTSGDYSIAIDEGADWIRLGTVIFGERS